MTLPTKILHHLGAAAPVAAGHGQFFPEQSQSIPDLLNLQGNEPQRMFKHTECADRNTIGLSFEKQFNLNLKKKKNHSEQKLKHRKNKFYSMHHLHKNCIYLGFFFFILMWKNVLKEAYFILIRIILVFLAEHSGTNCSCPYLASNIFPLPRLVPNASRESRRYYSKIKIKIHSILKSHAK